MFRLTQRWHARLLRSVSATATGLAACALTPLFSAPSQAQTRAESCETLTRLATGSFHVLESRSVAAGPAPAFADEDPDRKMPSHCLLRGSFGERKGTQGRTFEIRFELRMPDAWNGRFVFEGGGNMDGVDWPAHGSLFNRLSPTALERGFAVVRTNSGHVSPDGTSFNGDWATDQQARIDYGFAALDRVALKAKDIVAAYYGRPAERSYFIGCSNGGRQAMMAAQRFPTYFDGIVAGDAAFNLARIAPRLVWTTAQLHAISKPGVGAFTPADLTLLSKAVVKQCDALDGLRDGLIQDVAGCHFDPVQIQCKGAKTASCLSKAQVTTIRAIVAGPRDASGKPYYRPMPYDSTLPNWSGPKAADPSSSSFFLETMRTFALTPPDPNFDARSAVFPDIFDRVKSTAEVLDAEGTLLNSFAQHGKMIIYHGVSDYTLPVFEITGWYDKLARDTGGTTQDWARLFLVPGMTHCDGGRSTDQFDPLTAIQQWVEQGVAPERIVATGKELPGISRPLCAWPKVARYRGGDPNKAESFECG